MLGISPVQPLERFIGLVAESINLGDFVRTACRVFRDQLPQCGIRLLFPSKRVVRNQMSGLSIGALLGIILGSFWNHVWPTGSFGSRSIQYTSGGKYKDVDNSENRSQFVR